MDIEEDRARERREALADFWETVKRLPAYGRMVAAMAADERVPWRSRGLLVAAVPISSRRSTWCQHHSVAASSMTCTCADGDPAGTAHGAGVGRAEYLTRYGLAVETIDGDLATIRTLVRVGVVHGARWGARQVGRAGRWVGDALERVRSKT